MTRPRHSPQEPGTIGAADGGMARSAAAAIANEVERSAETAFGREVSRSSEKSAGIAGRSSLTVNSLVDHKNAFSVELIWNRDGTTDGIDWRRCACA